MNLNTSINTEQLVLIKLLKCLIFKVPNLLFDLKGIEHRGKRNVHTALLQDLKPDTKYKIIVFYSKKHQAERVYKTLPSELSSVKNLTMINGGYLVVFECLGTLARLKAQSCSTR